MGVLEDEACEANAEHSGLKSRNAVKGNSFLDRPVLDGIVDVGVSRIDIPFIFKFCHSLGGDDDS